MNRSAPTSAIGIRVAAGLVAVALFAMLPRAAMADYLVEGAVKGQTCLFYATLWSCDSDITVDAVEGSDGKLYQLPGQYSEVSEYDEATGTCRIRVASALPDPIGWLLDKALNLRYFEKLPDGIYQFVDIDFLIFRCKKSEKETVPGEDGLGEGKEIEKDG